MRYHDSIPALALAVLLGWGSVAAEEPKDPGSAPSGAPEAQAAEAPPAPPAPAAPVKPKLIDVNTASREKLMTLPGMSERFADRVIAGRPYRSRVDLKSRNVIPVEVFNAIVDRIVAKSPKLAPSNVSK